MNIEEISLLRRYCNIELSLYSTWKSENYTTFQFMKMYVFQTSRRTRWWLVRSGFSQCMSCGKWEDSILSYHLLEMSKQQLITSQSCLIRDVACCVSATYNDICAVWLLLLLKVAEHSFRARFCWCDSARAQGWMFYSNERNLPNSSF